MRYIYIVFTHKKGVLLIYIHQVKQKYDISLLYFYRLMFASFIEALKKARYREPLIDAHSDHSYGQPKVC